MRCITFVCLIAAQTTGGELVSKDGVLSVKGNTNEGMDAIGAGKGIAVHAVALLK